MAKIIASHNAKVLAEHRNSQNVAPVEKKCICQAGVDSCPLGRECLTKTVIYKATVTADDGEVRTYTGCIEPQFKKRLYRHCSDTSKRKYRTCTRLADWYFRKVEDQGVEVNVNSYKWEIVKRCFKYQSGGKKCDLCLTEKLCIMKDRDPRSLNRRTELMNSCKHRWKHRLCEVSAPTVL